MLAVMQGKADAYRRLARLDRPIGTLLLLWPTMAALWFAADGVPDPFVLGVFFVGVWLMRAEGCIINDYADRNLDKHVARTQMRPLANGEIQSWEALLLFGILGAVCFALVSLLNPLTVQMAYAGIVLTVIYPFTKRFLPAPQMFLGIVWSWSIPMAFAAQTGEVAPLAWLLFLANWCWTVAYDTMYGMVDREDDLKVGIRSSAIWFGRWDRHIIGLLQLVTLGLLAAIGIVMGLGWIFYAAIAIVALLFGYQQCLIIGRDREACFQAFLNNNWAGAALFLGVVLDYALIV
ncbi:4-hydroxybenzoate octaprenyltransferase [Ferrimonas lipolytica]|uniref:4-hydroxybenzoate octaprenyltransferase n=1 Tax=Ferrimonas lipolytica TaxID=2724191 RepID=A0A6H1UHB7_9GAMM|nr:4-hydroxybenzoate octaprenyltransferase [Ferrimonas lipolytica]QIZ78000.1 4-hydroxybenzoate octaprenyltransferase [Ferrimonas lipolytica]